ncbi:hypothetical protein WUBG_17631 [Wuchereria bancrofti]|nr:hypothetical protein WUBG_17631 [Wuchereria bancrofti]
MVGCGLWLLPLGFLERKDDVAAHICFTASISCVAFETCGSMNGVTLVAGDFTQFVMAVAQLLSTVGMLVVPFLVSWLAPQNTVQEWRLVVLIIVVVHTVADIIFCSLCSDKLEDWAFGGIDASIINQFRLESVRKQLSSRDDERNVAGRNK